MKESNSSRGPFAQAQEADRTSLKEQLGGPRERFAELSMTGKITRPKEAKLWGLVIPVKA